MDGEITVVARFKSKPGMEDELKKLLLSLIKPSRSDEGCINYDLHQAIDDPTIFLFYENWRSKAHLDKHSATLHVQQFRSKAKDLLSEAPQLTLMHMISK